MSCQGHSHAKSGNGWDVSTRLRASSLSPSSMVESSGKLVADCSSRAGSSQGLEALPTTFPGRVLYLGLYRAHLVLPHLLLSTVLESGYLTTHLNLSGLRVDVCDSAPLVCI